MNVSENDSIIQRLHKLNEAINSSGIESCDKKIKSLNLLAKDSIVDALLVLYDECNNEKLKKEDCISSFIKKYQNTVLELKKLRVNLNDFEQKKIIGKGHFGVVQVVREKQTGNVYALKTLRKSQTLAQKNVTFFEEERDIMATAVSPWLTHLQFAFQDEQNLYLLMDFHPGGDLLSLLDRFNYNFSEEMIQFYLSEITVSIHALHSMGYVHRDIKPDNILIDRLGHVKLADFGSAAKLTTGKIVRSKMPVGTPDYVAPEVLTSMNEKVGETSSYGIQCDYWSLGIMAYEMLYGDTPFKGEEVVTTYSNIMDFQNTLKFPSVEIEISDSLKSLIEGLLQEPYSRFVYSDIVKHKFFLHTNWNNLESTTPPFIPVVTSVDDTSNFEEFDVEQPLPCIEEFRTKPTFSGRQLPFVGYTFTRENITAKDDRFKSSCDVTFNASVLDDTLREPSHLEAELKSKKRELHAALMKIKELSNDSEQSRPLQQLEKRAIQAETRTQLLEKDLKILEESSQSKDKKIQSLQKLLLQEKSERSATEKSALEFLKGAKEKWKKKEEERMEHVNDKLERYEAIFTDTENTKKKLMEQMLELTEELNETKVVAYKYKKHLATKKEELAKYSDNQMDSSKIEEYQTKLEECQSLLEKERVNGKQLNDQIKSLISKTQESNKLFVEFHLIREENKNLKNELILLNEELRKSKSEIQSAENRLKDIQQKHSMNSEDRAEGFQCQLDIKVQECENLKVQIQDVSSRLNETLSSLDSRDSSYMSKQDHLENKLKDQEAELDTLTKENTLLLNNLSDVKNKEVEQSRKIKELENILASLSETITNLEKNKTSPKSDSQKLQAQLELLEKQLSTSQAACSSEQEKLHLAEDNLRKKSRELSDVKLDLRTANRELKNSQDIVQYLRDSSKELRESVKQKEDEIIKQKAVEDDLKSLISKHETEIEGLKRSKEFANSSKQREVEKFEEKTKELKQMQDEMREQQKLLRNTQTEGEKLKIEKRGLEKEIKLLEQEKEHNKKLEASTQERVADLEIKLKESHNLVAQLKEVCSEQDSQLSVLDEFDNKFKTLEEEKLALQKTIEKNLSELKASKAQINEEKSLKLFQEKRVKDLESRLITSDQESDLKVIDLRNQLNDIMKDNSELQSQISTLEDELREAVTRERTLKHEKLQLEGEIDLTREESAGHMNHIHSLKESNFKLTDGLEEAISKGELYKNKITEVEECLRRLEIEFKDKEVKLNSTIAQQIKLIDFLQAKTENPTKKRTTLQRFFGGGNKENAGGFMVAHQYRELDELLARERSHVKQLSAQLSKAHSEVVALKAQANTRDSVKGSTNSAQISTPKFKRPLEDLSNSPSAESSNQRMKHKIPHRWQSYLVMRAGRCSGCLSSIPFSRNALRCQDCGLLAHSKCAEGIANSCGLPEAFVHHYTQSHRKLLSQDDKKSSDKSSSLCMKGWVKVPRSGKACWEKRYAQLVDNELSLYDQEPVASLKPIKKVSLKQTNRTVAVHNSVLMSEFPTFTSSEIPYIIKIEINDRGANSSESVLLMTTTFEEKQKWFNVLEQVVLQINSSGEETTTNELSKGVIESQSLITLTAVTPVDVNTVAYLDEKTAIVGAVEGLFSFQRNDQGQLKFRARIEGINSVHQIIVVRSLGVAVLIAGKDNNVFLNDLLTLKTAAEASSIAKPSVSPVQIEPLVNCHLVEASDCTPKRTFLCAAASDRISILVWSHEKENFVVCRQYSTQEPCSCFLFTPHSLIVGAERFYKIDLKNFTIEEYLDERDTSLAYAIYGSAQMSSFPIAIIQISSPGKHEEFLLAFYEFGIFVDNQGRRTREFDLKFTSLPVGIIFRGAHLFVLHQNSVEVYEIRSESFTKIRGMSFDSESECAPSVKTASKMLNKPRFVGEDINDDSVVIVTTSKEAFEIISIRASFPSDPDSCSLWSANTSSMASNQRHDTSDSTSIRSEASSVVSMSAADADSSSTSIKRTKFPNFMRASKRSKKHN